MSVGDSSSLPHVRTRATTGTRRNQLVGGTLGLVPEGEDWGVEAENMGTPGPSRFSVESIYEGQIPATQ